MKRDNLKVILSVIVGVMIGLLIIYVLNSLFFNKRDKGCIVEPDNSTEAAQVFLMGTIGGDYADPHRDCWREHIVQPVLDELRVTYFNPVVNNWSEENAEIEARAIANAETIVLVITSTSPSIGSLSESGWAVLSAVERDQTIIVYIEPESDDAESLRARRIVLSQARTLTVDIENLYLVDSLDAVVATLREIYGS
jgi:hypothetical protein